MCVCFFVSYVSCYAWLLLRRSRGGGLLWVGSQNKRDTHFEYLAMSLHIKL